MKPASRPLISDPLSGGNGVFKPPSGRCVVLAAQGREAVTQDSLSSSGKASLETSKHFLSLKLFFKRQEENPTASWGCGGRCNDTTSAVTKVWPPSVSLHIQRQVREPEPPCAPGGRLRFRIIHCLLSGSLFQQIVQSTRRHKCQDFLQFRDGFALTFVLTNVYMRKGFVFILVLTY